MTLRHFLIYSTVYQERNMTAAAKRLFMTQPSVSQAIKELEQHYDTILFERFPKELHPTLSGELLYQYATSILEMNNQLEDKMAEGPSQHILRVGSNDIIGSTLLDNYLRSFQRKHPNEELRISIQKTSTISDLLRTNELDLILTDEFRTAADLNHTVFAEDDYIAVASASYIQDNLSAYNLQHNFSIGDLCQQRLLLRETGTDARDEFDALALVEGYHVLPYWESIGFEILLNAAMKGMGIAILPSTMVKNSLDQNLLFQLKVPALTYTRKLVYAYHKNKYVTPLMQDFFDICSRKTL